MKQFLLMLFCAFALPTFAQDTISGLITDENNQPLEGAVIAYTDNSDYAETDAEGKFELAKQKDKWINISYIGFESKEFQILENNYFQIQLKESSDLEELVISARRQSSQKSLTDNTNTMTMNSGELLKAACCNLAESFETNPSIDVNFSDAVSGTKQIRMLGLTSPYIMITEENIPSVRGASQAYGLTFTPGTWVESIQVTKGAGSVVNGYESMSGQINTELIKPATDIPFYLNLYGSQDSRFEANAHFNQKISDKWSSSLFLHGNLRTNKNDMNHDGFLDHPIGNQINVMNRWQYLNPESGWVGFLTARYMKDDKQMGELNFDPDTDRLTTNAWGGEIKTEKVDGSAKVGYVFPDMPYQSFGWQNAFSYHSQQSYFGLNQYDITQRSFYSNLIFSSIISNTLNKFSVGLNFNYDDYDESVTNYGYNNFDRTDYSTGVFGEYTYDNTDNFALVLGLRADYSNRLDFFVTPRMHLRYNPWKDAVVRLSAGRGKRFANIFAENQNLFASSRQFMIRAENDENYGLNPEIAWNYGLSFTQKFHLFNRRGDVTVDFYRTDFENQIVVDIDQSAREVGFYNLDGKSYANSFQLELNYNLVAHLNLRAAYKYYDVRTAYDKGLMQKPLQAKNRLFANLEYTTHETEKGGHWRFDFTWNWLDKQRLPYTGDNSEANRLADYSPAFSTFNAQITKVFSDRFEIYLGGENIGNYRQERVILGAEDPFGTEFDSTIAYGPIFGQMYYAGLRFKVK